MRAYLFAPALLALASCAHPNTAPPPESEPIGVDALRPDSTHALAPVPKALPGIVVEPHRTVLDKVFGRTPAPATYPAGTPVRAGKKSIITVNNVTGGQTNTTNTAGKNAAAGTGATGGKIDAPVAGAGAELTSIEKAKAPVSTGTGDATDQSGTGAASTIKGNGNAPVLTNTAPPKRSPWEVIADNLSGPVGYGLGAIVLIVALVKGGPWLVAAWRRSKNEAAKTV
ncbi:MAG: hypothetical protein ACRYFZ_09460 [Janthinobacterium lividum]